MADNQVSEQKKRTFRIFTYRGVGTEELSKMSLEQFSQLCSGATRRKLKRGLSREQLTLLENLRKAKREAEPQEKPRCVETHVRDMIILPEMIGCIVGIHNGRQFAQVELKWEMLGRTLGEFSITYVPIKHGRPGIGATASSKFIPLK